MDTMLSALSTSPQLDLLPRQCPACLYITLPISSRNGWSPYDVVVSSRCVPAASKYRRLPCLIGRLHTYLLTNTRCYSSYMFDRPPPYSLPYEHTLAFFIQSLHDSDTRCMTHGTTFPPKKERLAMIHRLLYDLNKSLLDRS